MKIREIILELREIMDRTKYGSWIDTNTKEIIYVNEYKHNTIMRKLLFDKYDIGVGELNQMDYFEVYDFGFGKGYVRVEHSSQHEINIQGTASSLQKIAHILIASCVQPEINEVYIDKREDHDPANGYGDWFDMPADRRNMMMYIKGETE